MTLLLTPWQPFNHIAGWSPMEPALPPSIPSDYASHKVGDVNSESESIPTSSGSGKKRSSRAGTRSVSTLSAAQLERKRANDRDAQRAIRQRTKDHIDGLEKTISDLRATQEDTEKLLAATQHHNREIIEENAYLRTKLNEAGIPIGVASYENPVRFEPSQFPLQDSTVGPIATSATQSDDVSSTPRSTLSLATSQASESQHNLWQQQQNHVVQSAPANLENSTMMQIGSSVTNWRSHDGLHNASATSRQVPTSSPEQPHLRYGTSVADQDSQWDAKPPLAAFQSSQVPQQYMAAPQQQNQPHQYHPPVATPTFPSQPTPPQPSSFQTPGPPPSEFQSLTIASPVPYQVPHQQSTLTHPTQYMMSTPGITRAVSHPEMAPATHMMHTQSAPDITYDPTRASHQYSQQSHHSLPLRHPSEEHNYPPGQYQG